MPSLLKDFFKTRFAWALALVGLLNLALFLIQPANKVVAANLPSLHSWEWWRTQSYVKTLDSGSAPEVVLLGSSLMMIPVSFFDADYLKKDLDAVHHDRSVYLEDMLKARANLPDLKCFNFALPGGMISDDYMIVRALMGQPSGKNPKLLIVGITLRDFLESHVQCAASTNTFKYFRHFFDIDDIADAAMPEVWQRLDYFQGKALYIVGKRLDMQLAFANAIQKLCLGALGPAHVSLNSTPVFSTNVAHNLKTEAEEGDYPLKPGAVFLYEDNSAEYKKRFSHPSDQLFKTESDFLERLLTQAKSSGVSVLLVNMPLTADNMKLMPPGYYERYLKTVADSRQKNDFAYLDLNDGKTFDKSNFRDTAHMNASGGKKLLDAIVGEIKDNQKELLTLRKTQPLSTASSERAKPI